MRYPIFARLLSISTLVVALLACPAVAVTVQDALKLAPIQDDVEYDKPTDKEAEGCKLSTEKIANMAAYVVRGAGGQVLRVFGDSNADGELDQWSYYLNGIESYRDIDSNFDGRADQYRWFGLGGSRWGVDENQDGEIDTWKFMSPEELTAEAVAAVAAKDVKKFRRILITPAELKGLGLGPNQEKRIAAQISTAEDRFQQAVAKQKAIDSRTKWVHFGATRPGTLPSGSEGSRADVMVYENVSALVDNGGENGQVGVGTLIRVGDVWRLTDIPTCLMDEDTRLASAYFFQPTLNKVPELPVPPEGTLSEEMRALVDRYDKLEKQLAATTAPAERGPLYEQLTAALLQLAAKSETQKDQSVWLRQLADALSAGAQTGDYPDGLKKLTDLYNQLARQSKTADDTGYVRFRVMNAEFAAASANPKQDYAKVQEARVAALKEFIEDFPTGPDAPEAMLQVAIAEEFSGNDEAAIEWYDQILKSKADELTIRKAQGARRRLTGVGKPLALQGKTVDGKSLDLSQLKGRFVLIHYWATWCEPCKDDIKKIDKLVAEYGGKFVPVGINVDTDQQLLADFLRRNKLSWPQIFEAGGLDSRLAVDLGILMVPTMILVDDEGKIVNRNILISEVESYLSKNLR